MNVTYHMDFVWEMSSFTSPYDWQLASSLSNIHLMIQYLNYYLVVADSVLSKLDGFCIMTSA